jgi:hypothetical protein
MRSVRLPVLVAVAVGSVVATGVGVAPSAQGIANLCADEGSQVTWQGTLRKQAFKHPNGSKLTAYVLRLAKTECMSGPDGEISERDVHLVDFDESGDLGRAKGLVGKKVTVTGELAWGATAWYYSPLAMDVTKIRKA